MVADFVFYFQNFEDRFYLGQESLLLIFSGIEETVGKKNENRKKSKIEIESKTVKNVYLQFSEGIRIVFLVSSRPNYTILQQ